MCWYNKYKTAWWSVTYLIHKIFKGRKTSETSGPSSSKDSDLLFLLLLFLPQFSWSLQTNKPQRQLCQVGIGERSEVIKRSSASLYCHSLSGLKVRTILRDRCDTGVFQSWIRCGLCECLVCDTCISDMIQLCSSHKSGVVQVYAWCLTDVLHKSGVN